MTRARNSANLASDGNLFVDITNDRTGIGSVVPAQNLHVAGTAGFHADVTFTGDSAKSTFWDRSAGVLKFNDNAYIKLGTGNDMSIYHDGTNNIIAATVPKNLLLQSDDLQLQDCSNSHLYVKCVRDSYVRLYHDNSTRFQTAAYGVNVTGTTDTDGLIVSGVATVTTMNVTGVLTYDDVTSVDSLGIGTFRTGVNVSGGQLDVGSNIKLGNAGIITASSYRGDGSQLTGIVADKIFEGNSSVEVIDTGTGKIDVIADGSYVSRFQKVNGSRTYMLVGNPQAVSNDYGINSGHLIVLGNSGSEPATLRLFGWGPGSSDGTINNRIDFASHQSGSGGQTFAKIETVIRGSNDNSSDMTFHTAASATVSEKLRITSDGHMSLGGAAVPSSTNGNVGLKFGIKSALNNVIIGETTNASMHGIILESRVTGRSGGARCSQIEMGNGTLKLYTAPSGGAIAEAVSIASDGSMGLGTTPETDGQANSLYFANGNANIWGSSNVNLYSVVNARYTGAGGFKYNNTAVASYVAQQSGTWEFHNAPSGTADSVATFTRRIQIDADGRLLVGAAAIQYAASPLYVAATGPVQGAFHSSSGGTNDQARIALGALASNPPYQRGVYLTAENNGAGHDFIVSCSASHSAGPSDKLRITSGGDYLFLGGTLRIKNSANNAQYGAIYGDSTSFHLNAGGNLKLYSGGGERFAFDNNGNIAHTSAGGGISYFKGSSEYVFGSNTSSPSSGGAESRFQIHDAKTRATLSLNAYMNNAGAPFLQFVSSRSGTVGTLGTKAAINDYHGDIRFMGDNGTNYQTLVQSAQILVRQKSTISDGDTVCAGEMQFWVGSDTGGSVIERLKIYNSGGVVFSKTTQGGAHHTGNTTNTFFKVGEWTGVGAASRCKLTVIGASTFDSGSDCSGMTHIYLAMNADSAVKGYFNSTGGPSYSHMSATGRQGVARVAVKRSSGSAPFTVEVWVAYNTGYSSNSVYGETTTGTAFVGFNVNTGSSSVPSNADELESAFTVQTASGGTSYERLLIKHNGGVIAPTSSGGFIDNSYHANPDPFADGSGLAYYRMNYNFQDSGLYGFHGTGSQGSPNKEFNASPHFSLVNSVGEPCWDNPNEGAINIPNLKNSYPFSMAAWINLSTWPTTSNNDLIMNLGINGQRVSLCIVVWSGTSYSDFSIMYGGSSHYTFTPSSRPTNEWIHVVYSVVGNNDNSHAIYQNGTALSQTNRGGGHGGSSGWALGGNVGNSERFSMGRIGSIRFFNKALSSSEASALYNNDKFIA